LDFVLLDEASMMDKEVWDILMGRLLSTKGRAWLTTTPKGRNNWTYTDFYLRSIPGSDSYDEDFVCLRGRTEDNDLLDDRDIDKLRMGYTGDFASQELDAEFVDFKGLVYKEFDTDIHTILHSDIPLANLNYYCAGVDWGFNDPFVFLWLAQDKDGCWYVLDEHYETGKVLQDSLPIIQASPFTSKLARCWADPSRPDLVVDFRRALKKPVIGAKREKDSVITGIQFISTLLKNGMLKIARRCRKTINEFQNYSWKERKELNSRDEPIDHMNHSMDALRYALYSERSGMALSITRGPSSIRMVGGKAQVFLPPLSQIRKEQRKQQLKEAVKKVGKDRAWLGDFYGA